MCVDLFLLLRVKPQKPQTKQPEFWFQFFRARGVWHLHPTTLNEAVDPSGRQDLIRLVYLQGSPLWCQD